MLIDDMINKIIQGDALELLKKLPDNSIDLIVSDPPYNLSNPKSNKKDKGFMGKEWDVLPSVELLKESLRVLKDGAFAFWLMTPRQDSQAEFIMRLKQAGYVISFTPIYWVYATGFPKAMNISKAVDKKLEIKRKVVGKEKVDIGMQSGTMHSNRPVNIIERDKTIATSPQAKELDGSYAGFQPKPAVEVIIISMKPLSEKTYVEQALKNKKGITWLDDCRIPYEKEYTPQERGSLGSTSQEREYGYKNLVPIGSPEGRFPANLLVSDDVLNDGKITISQGGKTKRDTAFFGGSSFNMRGYGDSGSFSRYFDLDTWARKHKIKTFPFLIVPKASKSEKNKGLENFVPRERSSQNKIMGSNKSFKSSNGKDRNTKFLNIHPTVKPIKIMSYLITLGSREGDIVLDPFVGSGTTAIASYNLNRRFIGFEMKEDYVKIAQARLEYYMKQKEFDV